MRKIAFFANKTSFVAYQMINVYRINSDVTLMMIAVSIILIKHFKSLEIKFINSKKKVTCLMKKIALTNLKKIHLPHL